MPPPSVPKLKLSVLCGYQARGLAQVFLFAWSRLICVWCRIVVSIVSGWPTMPLPWLKSKYIQMPIRLLHSLCWCGDGGGGCCLCCCSSLIRWIHGWMCHLTNDYGMANGCRVKIYCIRSCRSSRTRSQHTNHNNSYTGPLFSAWVVRSIINLW